MYEPTIEMRKLHYHESAVIMIQLTPEYVGGSLLHSAVKYMKEHGRLSGQVIHNMDRTLLASHELNEAIMSLQDLQAVMVAEKMQNTRYDIIVPICDHDMGKSPGYIINPDYHNTRVETSADSAGRVLAKRGLDIMMKKGNNYDIFRGAISDSSDCIASAGKMSKQYNAFVTMAIVDNKLPRTVQAIAIDRGMLIQNDHMRRYDERRSPYLGSPKGQEPSRELYDHQIAIANNVFISTHALLYATDHANIWWVDGA